MTCQLHSPTGHGFSHTASHPAYIHCHTTRISHTWGCRHCHIYSKKYSFTGVNIKRHLYPYIRENQIGEIVFCAKQIFFIKPLWMALLQTLPCSENDFCLSLSVLLQSPGAASRAKLFFQDDSALMSCLICLLHNSSTTSTSSYFFLPVTRLFLNFTCFLFYYCRHMIYLEHIPV